MDVRQAAQLARTLIEELTAQKFDAISLCEKREDGWLMEVDVVESEARLDDDDLLTTYRLELTADGSLASYRRIRKHKRFEAHPGAAA